MWVWVWVWVWVCGCVGVGVGVWVWVWVCVGACGWVVCVGLALGLASFVMDLVVDRIYRIVLIVS